MLLVWKVIQEQQLSLMLKCLTPELYVNSGRSWQEHTFVIYTFPVSGMFQECFCLEKSHHGTWRALYSHLVFLWASTNIYPHVHVHPLQTIVRKGLVGGVQLERWHQQVEDCKKKFLMKVVQQLSEKEKYKI